MGALGLSSSCCRAGARGYLSIDWRGGGVGLEVAAGEGGEVVCPSPELSAVIRVGEELRIAFGVTKYPAKICVVVSYVVFRVHMQGRGRGGGYSGLFLPLPGGVGVERWAGAGLWGPVLWGKGREDLSPDVRSL